MDLRRNIRLLLEYDGTRYHGWQRQTDAVTIQEVWKRPWRGSPGRPVALIGSGRTDAGVHARGQVANFRTASAIPLKAFHQGLNSLLPRDIAVLSATEAPPSFHARKSARAKTYEYRILNRPEPLAPCIATTAGGSPRPWTWRPWPRAAAALPGEHDFTAFRASGSDNHNPVRRVLAADWRDDPGGWLSFTITATGFLRGMVRSLVGTMAEVGRGKAPPTGPGGVAGEPRPPPGRTHRAAPGALPGGSVL